MKQITITVDVEGNSISRTYNTGGDSDEGSWNAIIADMLDTIEKSNEEKF